MAAGVSATLVAPAHAAGLPTARFAFADFGVNQGWDQSKHLRVLADVNGDHRADVVAFGNRETMTALATGDGGFVHGPGIGDFGYDQGWRIGTHQRFATDITGDGRADVVGVGNAGVYTSVSNPDGTFGPVRFVLAQFGATGRPTQFSLLASDVNADGRTDLVGFTSGRVDVALAVGDGGFAQPYLASTEFTAAQFDFNHFQLANISGDSRPELLAVRFSPGVAPVAASPRADGTFGPSHVSTDNGTNTSPFALFAVADVTGDSLADAVMPGQGVNTLVGTARGAATFTPFVSAVNDFGYNNGAGYGTASVPTASLADITGDHRADLIGFNVDGIHTSVSNGDGTFAPSRRVVADFGFNSGWRTTGHPRLLADITGDGRADVVGFGNAGVYVALANGDGTFNGGPSLVSVPDVRGETTGTARTALQNAGLVLGTVGSAVDPTCENIGLVLRQSPAANSVVTEGTAVNIVIGTRPRTPCP